ncbi:zinc-ribbon domain-containing protein [Staphylococcus arlettae]
MNCKNCGEHVDINDKFCTYCGHSIEQRTTTNDKNCPNCNAKIEIEDRFCIECGHNLKKEDGEINAEPEKNEKKETFNESTETIEQQAAPNINLKNEARNLF